jgi:hypothetical protein
MTFREMPGSGVDERALTVDPRERLCQFAFYKVALEKVPAAD